jgi:Kinesin motor domain
MPTRGGAGGTDGASGAGDDADAASDSSNRSKHIEVCVRLRPLSIPKGVSSSSFFHHHPSSSSSSSAAKNSSAKQQHLPERKPAIPRFSSKLMTPSSNKQTNSSSKSNHNHAAPTPETASVVSDDSSTIYAWDVVGDDTVSQSPATPLIPGRTHTYTLDRVYGPHCRTYDVYRHSVQDLVSASMEGYHTAVLAYGQTSTGKTHTMTGTAAEPGLIPLAVRECFAYLKRENNNNISTEDREYLLRVSYLEVYKEHIKDLLADHHAAVVEPVRLFEHAEKGLIIRGLKEEVVTSPEQVFGILAQGEARRQVGATHLNQHSSRSHVMVRVWIESRKRSVGGKSHHNTS